MNLLTISCKCSVCNCHESRICSSGHFNLITLEKGGQNNVKFQGNQELLRIVELSLSGSGQSGQTDGGLDWQAAYLPFILPQSQETHINLLSLCSSEPYFIHQRTIGPTRGIQGPGYLALTSKLAWSDSLQCDEYERCEERGRECWSVKDGKLFVFFVFFFNIILIESSATWASPSLIVCC